MTPRSCRAPMSCMWSVVVVCHDAAIAAGIFCMADVLFKRSRVEGRWYLGAGCRGGRGHGFFVIVVCLSDALALFVLVCGGGLGVDQRSCHIWEGADFANFA